jgi:GNAT superfamily N-acetyltransferase
MSLTIREYRPDDAEGVAEVRRQAIPFMISTAEGVTYRFSTSPDAMRLRLFVAELDGRIVGEAAAAVAHQSNVAGQSTVNPHVHPGHRRLGAGTGLLAAAEEYLTGVGATTVYAYTDDEPGSLAFAERHGYRQTRRSHFLRLGLAGTELPPLATPPAGVTLHSVADFAGDPRPFFEADAEATADEPGDIGADTMAYDEWLASTWRNPELDRELTTVAVEDGVVVAHTIALTDRRSGRYVSGGTGTRRAHRGRGLAKLVKNESLHRARAAGITEAFTGNDAANEPMLAVNEWFGYRPAAAEWRSVRELG